MIIVIMVLIMMITTMMSTTTTTTIIISTTLCSSLDSHDMSRPTMLQKMEVGYQLKKRGSIFNNLMFMDDIKLFERSTEEMDALI